MKQTHTPALPLASTNIHLFSAPEIFEKISLSIAALMIATVSLNASAQSNVVSPSSGAGGISQSTAQGALPIPRTENGEIDFDKWFAGKNRDQQEEMADALTDREFKGYTKYILKGNAELRARIAEKKADNAKLDAIINAIAVITAAGKKLQRGEALTNDEKNGLKVAVNTPGVKQHLIDGIKRHVNLD